MATPTAIQEFDLISPVPSNDYHPEEDELVGEFPSYNMLHPR